MKLPIPIDNPFDEEKWRLHTQWASTIMEEASEKLNAWEEKFMEDMIFKLEKEYPLTQAQAEQLERIYSEYTK